MFEDSGELFVPTVEKQPRFTLKFSAEEIDEEFSSAEQIIAALRKLPGHQVYGAAKDYFAVFHEEGKEFLNAIGIDLYEFVRNGNYWQGHDTLEEFEQNWMPAKKAFERRENDRRYIQSVFNHTI